MSDAPENPAPEAGMGPPPIVVNAQYTKDLSFESPKSPQIFSILQQSQPDIDIKVDVAAQPMENNQFEIQLQMAASCTVGEETAFILEVTYAGLVTLNVPQEHLQPVLLIECPRLLFPYLRQIVGDATRDGGFPPLMLAPMDFVAMYQRRMQELAEQQQQQQPQEGE